MLSPNYGIILAAGLNPQPPTPPPPKKREQAQRVFRDDLCVQHLPRAADSCDVLGAWCALSGFKLTYMATEVQGPMPRSASEAVVSSSCALVEPGNTVLGQGCAR